MADQNIRDFSSGWIQFGLLFFCLLSFAIGFMVYNNPDGLGESEDKFETYQGMIEANLTGLESNMNRDLNVTSKTNPEISQLGSRDSVATAYSTYGTSKSFLDTAKLFMAYVLTGTAGQIVIGVFLGIAALTGLHFITKKIRQG